MESISLPIQGSMYESLYRGSHGLLPSVSFRKYKSSISMHTQPSHMQPLISTLRQTALMMAEGETHVRVSRVGGSVCIYRGEDMQDGVNVPALGGRIPDRDRDTHTHTQWCLRVSQTHTNPSASSRNLHTQNQSASSGREIYSRNSEGNSSSRWHHWERRQTQSETWRHIYFKHKDLFVTALILKTAASH